MYLEGEDGLVAILDVYSLPLCTDHLYFRLPPVLENIKGNKFKFNKMAKLKIVDFAIIVDPGGNGKIENTVFLRL